MLQPRAVLRCLQRQPTSLLSLSSQRSYQTYATSVILKQHFKGPPKKPEVKAETESSLAADGTKEFIVYEPPPIRDPTIITTPLRTYKPRTPSVRHLRRPVNAHLWKGRPLKELTFPKTGHGKGGRNCTGHVTVRHRGGGHKRRIRTVDYSRIESGPQTVQRIEYDPNRSAHIALLKHNETTAYSYIIAAEGMRAGDVVQSYRKGIPDELKKEMGGSVDAGVLAARTAWRGNCLPLHMIPVGSLIFNISVTGKSKAIFCRSAGTYATVVSKGDDTVSKTMAEAKAHAESEDISLKKYITAESLARMREQAKYVTVKLKSGEVRLIDKYAVATIGIASNAQHEQMQLGKAGRKRWLGIRPTVRGLAMNAMDHPHGGGRGKSKGNVKSKSPWGLPVCSSFLPSFSFSRSVLTKPNRPRVVTRLATSTRSTRWLSLLVRETRVVAEEVTTKRTTAILSCIIALCILFAEPPRLYSSCEGLAECKDRNTYRGSQILGKQLLFIGAPSACCQRSYISSLFA